MTEKFISIEGITKRFPAGGGETTVFEDLWLAMARGEFVCIIGHSGCGKTTVLNILAGLDVPSQGAVIVDNEAIEGPSLDRAVIFQSHALLPWRTVLGNVAYAVTSKWRKWDRAKVKAHVLNRPENVGGVDSDTDYPPEGRIVDRIESRDLAVPLGVLVSKTTLVALHRIVHILQVMRGFLLSADRRAGSGRRQGRAAGRGVDLGAA